MAAGRTAVQAKARAQAKLEKMGILLLLQAYYKLLNVNDAHRKLVVYAEIARSTKSSNCLSIGAISIQIRVLSSTDVSVI